MFFHYLNGGNAHHVTNAQFGFRFCPLSVDANFSGPDDAEYVAFRNTFANTAQEIVETLVLMFFVNFEQNSPVGIGFFLCFQFFVLPIGRVQHIMELSLGKRPNSVLDTPHSDFI